MKKNISEILKQSKVQVIEENSDLTKLHAKFIKVGQKLKVPKSELNRINQIIKDADRKSGRKLKVFDFVDAVHSDSDYLAGIATVIAQNTK